MRTLIAFCVIALGAAGARAETITATNGTSYTRAKDGHLYPSQYVRADGSVSTTPVASAKAPCTSCGPVCPCPSGVCPACPVTSPIKVEVKPAPFAAPLYLPQSNCPNGQCQQPARGFGFFRR